MCMGNHHRVLDRLSSLGLCSINRRSNGTDNERSNMKRYYWSKIADGLYEKKVRKAKRKKKLEKMAKKKEEERKEKEEKDVQKASA